MTEELNIVRRVSCHDVQRQARTPSEHRPHTSRRGLLIGLVVLSLCVAGASAALVNYLSGRVHTEVTVVSPITITPSTGWEDFTTSGGLPFDMSCTAHNAANAKVSGAVDLSVNYSLDDGATWTHINFGALDNGITITLNSDSGTIASNGDMRFAYDFPTTPDQTLIFHVITDQGLQPALYHFSAIVRPISWS